MPKILIIRFSSIGDIVLTSPVVRCIRSQLPDAEIHYLTKDRFVPLLSDNPHITRIYSIHKRIREVLPTLKRERYDFIVDLHHNWRTFGVKLLLGRPGASFPKLNIRKWLLVHFKRNTLPDIHVVDRYFQAVRNLGVQNDHQGLDYFIPGQEWIGTDQLPATHRNGYVALVIGARHNTKILPVDKIIALCMKLATPVVLLGGPEDQQRGRQIASAAGPHVFNGCGLFTIHQSASLIAQADRVITHDTGLMHIAAAFRKRIVSVWGNTVPAFGMYPYLPGQLSRLSSMVEVKGLSCRPCSKLGYTRCPKRHFRCMNDINVEEILREINGPVSRD